MLLDKAEDLILDSLDHYKLHFIHIIQLCIEICIHSHNESVEEWFLLVDELKYFKTLLEDKISPYLFDLMEDYINKEAYPLIMR